MSTNTFPAIQLLQDKQLQLTELIERSHANVHINREMNYIFEILRVNYNEMYAKNSMPQAITSCDPFSVLNCVEMGLEMGLSFNPMNDFLYLIPRWNKALNAYECSLMIGYKGYKKLAANAKVFSRIDTQLVRANDYFQFNGTSEKVEHPFSSFNLEDRGAIVGGYCMAKLKDPGLDGEYIVTMMSQQELQDVEQQATSNNKGFSVWNSAFKEQMYLKTIIRRGFKDWEYVITENSQVPNIENIVANVDKTQQLEASYNEPQESNAQQVLGEQEVVNA